MANGVIFLLKTIVYVTFCVCFCMPLYAASTHEPVLHTAALCDLAAGKASRSQDVPLDVLLAISRTESGRRVEGSFVSWPWTINDAGHGQYFPTQASAEQFVGGRLELGARSIDIGCFQINYRWHHDAFPSVAAMFDPEQNALYAASFLKSLFLELGSWDDAIGAYHSRTATHAERYRSKVSENRALVRSVIDDQGLQISDTWQSPANVLLSRQMPVRARRPFGSLVPKHEPALRAFISVAQGAARPLP